MLKVKKKILFVLGTRPEAIKLAPLIIEAKKNPAFKVGVCSTGQHKEMVSQIFDFFKIKENYNLSIMRPNQTIGHITSTILNKLPDVIEKSRPEILIVHGDTTTSFTAALCAYYARIKVAHVEAGLRTWDKYSPFPEEINRKLTGSISDFHFAPTKLALSNLIKEGVPKENISVTGNTVIDALFLAKNKLENDKYVSKQFDQLILSKRIVLITGHRRENFGDGFLNICKAIRNLAIKYKEVQFIYPVHLNPNVQKPVYEILNNDSNIHLIPPVDYKEFVFLMSKSYLILSDSGGVQEEAPSLGKPILVMRDTTERPEALNAGTAKLVGTNPNEIEKNVSILLENRDEYKKMSSAKNPYGDGLASKRILEILEQN